MRCRSGFLIAQLCLVLGSWTSAGSSDDAQDGRPTKPRELGIREHAERRLIQLDVTVSGPPKVIPWLTADDFDLVVGNLVLGGQPIVDLTLDRFCPSADPTPTAAEANSSPRPEDVPPRASYVFYFEGTMSHFAASERTREMVRELIVELVDDRSPATIISGGRTLRTYAYNTSDHEELYAALERLGLEAAEQDNTIMFPRSRLWDVRRALRWSGRPEVFARERAFRHQMDEIDRTYLALTRLAGVMPGLDELPLPKVLFYIGNRLNSRPGQIYNDVRGRPFDSMDIGPTDPWAVAQDFDLVIQDAAAVGVRIYPIFPAGPTHSLDPEFMRALRASQWSMRALAVQTGGRAFFWGTPVGQITKKLKGDLSCTYLLSFDPKNLPEDERLGVDLRVNRPRVKARTRAQIVVRGAQQRREAELLAAFLTDGGPDAGNGVTVEVVAANIADAKAGVVRVTLPALTSGATWRLRIWLVQNGVDPRQLLENAIAPADGLPVVLEYTMRFKPGAFELILVAHEPEGDQVLSKRLAAVWPDVAVDPAPRSNTE